MKIDILSICNLNSLYGNNTIEFNKEPFNGSGLFAITGPTGAGKSTIFDAISLALYGRTPRLKNPDEIMSRHTGECYSELTFSINGSRYRSRWEQRKSRGKAEGKLQSAKMSLVGLGEEEETLLEEKKSAVPQKITDITGLDYDQFSRSMMLAQGNFESFLKAGVNDRAELLEKMTGTELYTRLSIEAFNKAKEMDEVLIKLKEKTGETDILSQEKREELEGSLLQLSSARKTCSEDRNRFLAARTWKEQDIVLSHRIDNCRYEVQEAVKLEDESKKLEEVYRRKKIIVDTIPLFESWEYLQREKSRLERDISDLGLKIKEIQNLLTLSNQSKRDAFQNKLTEEKIAEETVGKIRIIEIQENTRKSLLEQIDVLNSELKEETYSLENSQQELISRKERVDSLRRNQESIEQYLALNSPYEKIGESLSLLEELFERIDALVGKEYFSNLLDFQNDKNNDLEQLKKMISLIESEKPGELSELKNIKEVLKSMGPISKRFREVREDNNNCVLRKNNYTQELKSTSLKIKELECQKDKYISAKKKMDYAALVHEVKRQLHDGDVCPVCRGTVSSSVLEEKSNAINLEMENPEDELSKIITKENVLKERLSDINSIIIKNQATLDSLLTEWNETKEDLFPGLLPDQKNEAVKIYTENEQLLTDCRTWESEIEVLYKEQEELVGLNMRIEEACRIRDKILSLYKSAGLLNIQEENDLENLKRMKVDFAEKKRIHGDNGKELQEQEHHILSLQRRIRDLSDKKERLSGKISQLKSQHASVDELIRRESNGKSVIQLEKEVKESLDSVNTIYEQILEENNLLDKKHTSYAASLQQMEENLPLISLEWREKNERFSKLLTSHSLSLSDFSRKDNLPEELIKLDRQIKESRDAKIRAEEAFDQAMKSLEEHSKKKPSEKLLEGTTAKIEKLDKEINELSSDIGGLEEKLNRDNILRSRLDQLTLEIENQEKECLKWSRLRSLIGSADGKSFRRFVQGLTLDKLVGLANNHLEKLNNRYRIERSAEKELEVEIVDSWQADTVRPASTLSGGESFLVSLALSLGLSELVGNKVVIDSLFLDEGFGTLDPESLEVVLSALETLQAGGKLIGIISHISAIRERINVQIKVRKLSGGKSHIEIV